MSGRNLGSQAKYQFRAGLCLAPAGKTVYRLSSAIDRLLAAMSEDLVPEWMATFRFTRTLETYATLFRMNEMEVAAWHCGLKDALSATFDPNRLTHSLWMTAYNAKSSLSGSMEETHEILRAEDQESAQHMSEWLIVYPHLCHLTMRKINESYQHLNSLSNKTEQLKTLNTQVNEIFMKEMEGESNEAEDSVSTDSMCLTPEEFPGQFTFPSILINQGFEYESKEAMEWYDELTNTLEGLQG